MSVKAIDLRRGITVNWKNGIWVCVTNEKVAKGNWRSYQVVQLKNVKTGQVLKERFRTDEEFDQAIIDRKVVTYLYSDTASHIVMDNENYEQIPLPADLIGDDAVYLAENLEVQVIYVDGIAVSVELPNMVELEVIDTPPAIKGATATNQLKDAICEGGARIRVPPFVVNGTIVKVDTRSGEYLSRA